MKNKILTEKEALVSLLRFFQENGFLPQARDCSKHTCLYSMHKYNKIFGKWSVLTEKLLLEIHSICFNSEVDADFMNENSSDENSSDENSSDETNVSETNVSETNVLISSDETNVSETNVSETNVSETNVSISLEEALKHKTLQSYEYYENIPLEERKQYALQNGCFEPPTGMPDSIHYSEKFDSLMQTKYN